MTTSSAKRYWATTKIRAPSGAAGPMGMTRTCYRFPLDSGWRCELRQGGERRCPRNGSSPSGTGWPGDLRSRITCLRAPLAFLRRCEIMGGPSRR